MTSRSSSAADFFSLEEREEMRFLRSLKAVLRADAAEVQESENLTQEQLAERVGVDPAQLSRALSADKHNSTSTIFRIMHRLGRRWSFSSAPLPVKKGANAPEMITNHSTDATLQTPIGPSTFQPSDNLQTPLQRAPNEPSLVEA